MNRENGRSALVRPMARISSAERPDVGSSFTVDSIGSREKSVQDVRFRSELKQGCERHGERGVSKVEIDLLQFRPKTVRNALGVSRIGG